MSFKPSFEDMKISDFLLYIGKSLQSCGEATAKALGR